MCAYFLFVGFASGVAVVCPWLDFGQILPKLRGRSGGVLEEEREVRVGLKISSGKTCVVKSPLSGSNRFLSLTFIFLVCDWSHPSSETKKVEGGK